MSTAKTAVTDEEEQEQRRLKVNGWTCVAVLTLLAAFGHWCVRPTSSITGGGGLTSIDAIFNLIPDAISNLKTIASFFASFAVLPKFMPGGTSYWGQHAGGSVQYTQLVVAVTSSLGNLDQRNAVRKTWKRLTGQTQDAKLFFVMAENPCHLDPQWRVHESTCEEWRLSVPINAANDMIVKPIRVVPSMIRPGVARDGVGFHVKYPIVIENLGVAKRALVAFFSGVKGRDSSANLTVDLVDSTSPSSELVVASVNFTRKDLTSGGVVADTSRVLDGDDGFVYKAVAVDRDGVTCTRGLNAKVRIRNVGLQRETTQPLLNPSGITCNLHWSTGHLGEDGVVAWTSVFHGGHSLPFDPHVCLLASFVYRVPDVTELRQVANGKDTKNKCQESKNINLAAKLVEEMEDNDEDMFVVSDLIDTPSNIPLALASFTRWLTKPGEYRPYYSHNPLEFEYLLVTKDTSFVSLDKLLPRLRFGNSDPTIAANFRSKFRYFVPSEGNGYVSATYPPVPASTGALLSHDLVRHLALSAESRLLKSFSASVSISLGVWLAPASPSYNDDSSSWSPDNSTCSEATILSGPYTAQGLLKSWKNYLQCGRICKCS